MSGDKPNGCFQRHVWVIGVCMAVLMALATVVFAMTRDYDSRLRTVEQGGSATAATLKRIEDDLKEVKADVKVLANERRKP